MEHPREKIRLRRAGNAADWPPVFQVMFDTTRVPAALDCKGCLLQAIAVLEWFHHLDRGRGQAKDIETDCAEANRAASVKAELSRVAASPAEPQGRLTVRLIREFALVQRWPTVVYCRTRRPATVALELLGVAVVDGSLAPRDGRDVLVTPSREAEDDRRARPFRRLAEDPRDRVSRLERRDDPLLLGEGVECGKRLVVGHALVARPAERGEVRVLGPDGRVVEPGRDGVSQIGRAHV